MSVSDLVESAFSGSSESGKTFGIRSDLLERFIKTIRRDLRAKIGFLVVALFGLSAIFAPMLAPYDPMSQQFPILMPPDPLSANPLGTDSFGRDLLSRLMYGARISLAVGLGAVTFGAVLGILIGLFAGYYGGYIDDLLMRAVDVMWAFPWLLIAIMLVAIFGQGFWNVMVAIGFAYIDDFARLARGEVLAIREEEYTMAAKSVGLEDYEIIFEEVFPNTVAPLIVQFTIFTARAILAESTLSFLGLGVKPTTPTWGALLGQGRGFITQAWWISIIPGIAIMVTVLGINLFGDALRDAFDVKETGQT
ncbi:MULTISPECIES: ABC transporter permease [Halorubrum]|uniref:Peptide/nickel transport system permease protein n=1 Tax=Halorubrum sodomense TaxID=35743 RepID=A0A1I6H1T5_HALSD|nr:MULTISPECIES: ABC transporter permease [Halorubrum]TKX55012.1 ABC transporter permease [Halorubrum sp. SP3]TKX55637.1 ABC transporter permease [Halorubrum sp. SS7]TKX68486.1 ABC transporter permease [Halorubrum sp. SP9]SFR48301.1 peptide/nickel transport system permease protein [Halorubrum sodomense]